MRLTSAGRQRRAGNGQEAPEPDRDGRDVEPWGR
jgi:hypothetical protein